MKTKIYLIVMITFFLGIVSCSNEESIKTSQINTETPQLSDLDLWIRENFVVSYNIDIQYKWSENEVDLDDVLFPPTEDKVQPILELIKAVWIKSYREVAGANFIKTIAPRKLILIGGGSSNFSGSDIEAAQAGTKITIFNVDQLDVRNKAIVNRYFMSIQHGYAHVLSQNKNYGIAYGKVNPKDYSPGWINRSNYSARQLGYITAYASKGEREDFAEMIAMILTNSKPEFDQLVNGISNKESRDFIRKKELIIAEYFSNEFGIDLYRLQEVMYQNTKEVMNQ